MSNERMTWRDKREFKWACSQVYMKKEYSHRVFVKEMKTLEAALVVVSALVVVYKYQSLG